MIYSLCVQYLQVIERTQNLLWNLLDLLDIINGTGKVDATDTFHQNFKKSITICQLYDFVKYHREYSCN